MAALQTLIFHGNGAGGSQSWPQSFGAQSIFADDFSSGDLSKTQNGFVWDGINNTGVIAGVGRGGSHGLRFRYPADVNDSFAEQRFAIGSANSEIWCKFWMRVPDNFDHAPGNNKLFAIWMDDYSASGGGPTVVWEYWPQGAGSELAVHWSEGDNVTAGVHILHAPFISIPADRGRWMEICLHVKAATTRVTPINPSSNPYNISDGIIQLWRRWDSDSNWTQLHDVTTANIAPPPGGPNGFSYGYVLGWCNSGFAEETDFVVDDFAISASSLLGEVAGGGGTTLFADDFSGRTLGGAVANTAALSGGEDAQWLAASGDVYPYVVSEGYNGGNALQFRYPASAPSSEQRYEFDSTGALQIDEVWVEFWIYIPANYDPSGGSNNKFIFLYNDDTGSTMFYDHEAWPITSGPLAGGASLDVQIKRNGANTGWAGVGVDANNTYNNVSASDPSDEFGGTISSGNSFAALEPFVRASTDLGSWIGIRINDKLSSAAGVADARSRIWKYATSPTNPNYGAWFKILDVNEFVNFQTGINANGHSNNHMSGGYLMGWHNSAYAEQTDFRISDFKIYSSNPGWGVV